MKKINEHYKIEILEKTLYLQMEKIMNSRELTEELIKYNNRHKNYYPIPTLEEFCLEQNILTNKLLELADSDLSLEDAIRFLKQKQKILVMKILTTEDPSYWIVDSITGERFEKKIDKRGVYMIAKHLGIG